MSVPSAKEMAEALRRTGRVLTAQRLIKSDHVLFQAASTVTKSDANSVQWAYEITPANPLEFVPVHCDELDRMIRPMIYAKVNVAKLAAGGVCFKALDLALTVVDDENRVLIKHHVDLANHQVSPIQPGPLFHLQFGGHTPKSSRIFEVGIKQPRWLCMPLDLVLLCEVVVANFYASAWVALKEESSWIEPIGLSQNLCVGPFLKAVQSKLNISSKSVLDHLWASNAGPSYSTDGF